MKLCEFTVYAKPVPQGSMKGFVIPGKGGKKARAIVTSDNTKLKPYRQEVSLTAMRAKVRAADKHVPVRLEFDFYLAKPETAPKKRTFPVVKPDLDKLIRATSDALTGILYFDDAQIVDLRTAKMYGSPERVVIRMYDFAAEAKHAEAF